MNPNTIFMLQRMQCKAAMYVVFPFKVEEDLRLTLNWTEATLRDKFRSSTKWMDVLLSMDKRIKFKVRYKY